VLSDKRSYKIAFLDVVHISPNTPHQLLNPFDEPFGFLCVVPAKRDKPINIAK
jgi:ribulose-bisphosphate carboxylase large chain